MLISITGKTDRFNLSVVKENFVNKDCFGEDFSHWLATVLEAKGVEAFVMGMDTSGWENVVKYQGTTWQMHISGLPSLDAARPNYGEWRLALVPRRSLVQKLLGRNKGSASDPVCEKIAQILAAGRFEEVRVEG